MGMLSCCCLNPLPPTIPPIDPISSSPSLPKRKDFAPRKVEEGSWRNKYVVAMACSIIIGIEVGDIILGNISGNESWSNTMASELRMESKLPNNNNNNNNNRKGSRIARWSEKRNCPSWHLNSLETIVPENLPRPFTPRKWEGVSYSPKSSVHSRTSCYTM